jgi:hypothetical protein
MSQRLLPPATLREYGITIGNKQRQRLEATGRFPKRVAITERTHGYVEDEIIAYSEARVRQRDRELVLKHRGGSTIQDGREAGALQETKAQGALS